MNKGFSGETSRILWELSKYSGDIGIRSLLLKLEHPERYPEYNLETERDL